MMLMPLFVQNKEAFIEREEGGYQLTAKASEEEIQSFYDYYRQIQPEIGKEVLDELASDALQAHPDFSPSYDVPTEQDIKERQEIAL